MSEESGEWLCAGCHCGAVRLRVHVPESDPELVECDCSICTKKGFLHLIVGRDRIDLDHEPGALSEYRFGTKTARHLFCAKCGIAPYYIPRSHPHGISVNVRCLEDPNARAWRVRRFAGSAWEHNIASLREPS